MPPTNNIRTPVTVARTSTPKNTNLPTGYSVSRAATSALPGVTVQFTAQPINRLNSPLALAGRVLAVTIVAGSGATLSATSITTNPLGIATVGLTVGPSAVAGTIYRVKVTDAEGLTGTSANLTVVYDTTPAAVVLAPSTLSLVAGATGSVSAEVQNAEGGPVDGTLVYHSSNTSVATVSSSGVVTAVAAGSATITATAGALAPSSCAVTVSAAAPATTTATIQELVAEKYDLGFLKVYGGTKPASPTLAATGAYLATNRITSPAWGTPSSTSVAGVNWSFVMLTAIGAGAARYMRILDEAGGNPIDVQLPSTDAWPVGYEVTLALTATDL